MVKFYKPIIISILFLEMVFGCLWPTFGQSEAQPISLASKKELPEITFKNISPPYKDYAYFQKNDEYAFQFNATAFNLTNAWWLAESSTLVYAEQEFVTSRFHDAGLPVVKFFENQGTQCYVASNDQFAIVAFRGSEIWKKKEKSEFDEILADFLTNINIRLTDWEQGGKVHKGFKKALNEIWPDLFPYVKKLQRGGAKIWVTGHSLGGALATLFAGRYGHVQGVYTFGSPRVGDDAFKESFDFKVCRFVNNRDIITRIPPRNPYVHVGVLKFIGMDGAIRDRVAESQSKVNPPGDEENGLGNNSTTEKNSFGGFIPAEFRDHVPMLYAIHIWNNIVDKQNNHILVKSCQ